MNTLTKQYRIVYNKNNKVIITYGKYNLQSTTKVGRGKEGIEFNNEEDMNQYIKNNNLITLPDDEIKGINNINEL
jgi:UDP-N-acetylglucosamine transferase subunit ALG13